jgi:hypothetical protein
MMGTESGNIQVWDKIINSAVHMPGSRVSRNDFLRKELSKFCDASLVEAAIAESPAVAGVPQDLIRKISDSVISSQRTRTTSLSVAAGLPGGWWAAGTIPADISQFFWSVTVVSQKLAYLHGWPDLNESGADDTDEKTKEVLTLFIGVMFGVNAANKGITRLSAHVASNTAKRISDKALTKTTWYPLLKKIAAVLGYKITKESTGKSISKVIPLLGGAISGGMTWVSFGKMSNRLRSHLEGLYLHTRKPEDLAKENSIFEDEEDIIVDDSDETGNTLKKSAI